MQTITFEQLPTVFSLLLSKVENIEKLLQQPSAPSADDMLLTIEEASQILKLSTPTIYGLVSRSLIPVNKKGKRLYFSKQELTNWVKSGRRKTQEEIQSEAKSLFPVNKRK